MIKNHEFWMQYALKLAKKAQSNNEIPVGSVLVLDNNIIGQGWNSNIKNKDPTAHAEILALREGGIKTQNYRLINSTLYVTLEPCLMCIGAIINSRINHVVFGSSINKENIKKDFNIFKIFNFLGIEKKIKITKNILNYNCSYIIKKFFNNLRIKKKLKLHNFF